MNIWKIVALPQGDEIMKNGKVADAREAEFILNNHERLVEALINLTKPWGKTLADECAALDLLEELEKGQ